MPPSSRVHQHCRIEQEQEHQADRHAGAQFLASCTVNQPAQHQIGKDCRQLEEQCFSPRAVRKSEQSANEAQHIQYV
ncbi:hypothetical protein D3C85_1600150 [compost metagenome]